jgi:hypothetical protein
MKKMVYVLVDVYVTSTENTSLCQKHRNFVFKEFTRDGESPKSMSAVARYHVTIMRLGGTEISEFTEKKCNMLC